MGANVISSLYVEFIADTKKFAAGMQEISRNVREVEKIIKPIKDRAADAGRAMTIGFTVPVIAGFAAVTRAGMAFESGFASVRKTVTASEPEFARLRKEILDLSQVLPVAASELSEIAAVGGQFNVPVANLQKFTKTMAELSITTGISGREIAETLGQFTNITKLPKDQIDRLGSSITALGNEIGASEKKVLDFGLRIAGAGKIIGLTDAQILGFGGALASVGVEAEAGGTAISKTFIAVANAAQSGGKKLEQFAAVAGISAKDFATKFKTDAAGAITLFVEGLGRVAKEGGNVFQVMKDMGLNEVRLRTALLSASQAGDKLRTGLALATDEFKKNTATQKEVAERTKTTASQWILLKNNLDAVGVTFFDSFGPFLKETVIPNLKSFAKTAGELANAFNKLSPEVKTFTFYVLAIAAVVGPALTALTKLASTFIGLASFAYKAGISIAGFNGAVQAVSLLGAVKSYGDLQAAIALIGGTSAAATAGLVAIAAAVGVAIGMFINWAVKVTGLQGSLDKLIKTTVEYIPLVGKWATGANAATDAAKSAAGTTEKLVAEFKKYNIAVDTARLGDASYVRSLTAMVQERQKANAATKVSTTTTNAAADAAKLFADQQKLMADAFGETESEATKAAKKIQEFRDNLEKASRPADALNKELEEYRKLGASNTELSRAFAEEIIKAADAQALHGFAVKGLVAELLNEATAFTKVEEATKWLKKFREDMKNAPPLQLMQADIGDKLPDDLKSKTLSGLAAQRQGVFELNDALAKMPWLDNATAIKLFGSELDAAAEAARTMGTDILSPTTERLIEYKQGLETSKESQERWNAASDKGVDAMIAMRENLRTTVEAIRRMKESGASTKQVVAVLGGDLKTLGENAKLLGVQLDEPTKQLVRMAEQGERTAEIAGKIKDAWSTAVGNITSSFADGVTDMLFSGKKFSIQIKSIFTDLGKSIVKILVTDAFSQITKGFLGLFAGAGGAGGGAGGGIFGGLISGLGGKLAGLLGIGGGAAAAAGGTAAAGGAAAAGGGAAGGGAGLAALASNPITIAAAAAIAGALIIKKFVGQGRKTANEFVQNVQNPFGSNLSNIVDTFDAAKKAGTLTLEQAQQSKSALTELWSSFVSTANQFAGQGENEAKVVKQAFDSLSQYFGTDLSKVFGPMDETIKALQLAAQNATAGANVPGVGAGIPQTGRAQSASEIFAKAVERFEAAIDRVTGGNALDSLAGAGAGGIVVQYEDKREINFYGLSESLQAELRDTIEPALMRDFENNTRGITAALIAILNNAAGGVTNTVPATT